MNKNVLEIDFKSDGRFPKKGKVWMVDLKKQIFVVRDGGLLFLQGPKLEPAQSVSKSGPECDYDANTVCTMHGIRPARNLSCFSNSAVSGPMVFN